MTILYWPRWVNVLIVGVGLMLLGHQAAVLAAPRGLDAVTVVRSGETFVSTKLVKKVVHGRVIRRHDKVYVLVPVVVVHTDDHTIRVPAHKLPLRSAAATVANPLVTVRVAVPTTVYVPTVTTVTTTVTDVLPPVTTTITVPLADS